MEQEVAVRMTNFALILNDLTASFEGRNDYITPWVGEQAALQRRGLHAKLFRGAALAAVQKTVLAGVVSRFQPTSYTPRLCRAPLLTLDDFGMERGTEYGLEQVYSR